MKSRLKRNIRALIAPVGRAFARVGISAEAVTIAGGVFAVVSAYGFWQGRPLLAFGGLLASGLADLLDGAVARANGTSGTRSGALLDSTLDRYGEGVVFGGILLGLVERQAPLTWLVLAVLAGVGSFLVSYVRARAEGLAIACEVGWMERPERLVLLLALGLWGDQGAPWILALLALFTHITFVQRLVHGTRVARREGDVIERRAQAPPAEPYSAEPPRRARGSRP